MWLNDKITGDLLGLLWIQMSEGNMKGKKGQRFCVNNMEIQDEPEEDDEFSLH